MKPLLIALVALIAAVIAGHYVAQDPGFIVIGYGGKVVRTTFAFFLFALTLGIVVLFATLSSLGKLRRMREHWQRWSEDRRRRRAHDSLANGLMAMAGGDFAGAEKTFRRGVDEDSKPEAHYLAAATAAQAQKASGRRDNYLRLAQENNPAARTALNIKRVEWLLDNDQVSEARPIIERLAASEIGNSQVLRLRMELYRHTHDDAALLALLPDLRRDHVLGPDDANAQERSSTVAVLHAASGDLQALNTCWKDLSKYVRAQPEVLRAYVRGLSLLGADDQAEALVRKQLERAWSSELAALYGEIACEPPARQLRKLEAWSVTHADDPGLRLARARQSIRAGLWGQARTQIEALMRHAPSPLLHQLLAEIADGMGDPDAAFGHRKTGLELATGAAYQQQAISHKREL